MKNRQHFDAIVRIFKQQYQQLLLTTTFVFDVNFRFRFKTFVKKNLSSISFSSQQLNWIESLTFKQFRIQSTAADNSKERSVRVNQYRNDTRRFNVHADVHFDRIIAEYDFFSHCNVLIGENKHRYFKKIVYYTNHSNIEKIMLLRENLRQTMRLFLLNDFANAKSETTALIKNIHQRCFSLFFTLLSRSKQMLFENDDSDSRFSIIENVKHFQSIVIDCLAFKYCRNVLKLFTRSFENEKIMSKSFKSSFVYDYQNDYAIFNVMHFGTIAIQWCKKFAFTDPQTKHRMIIKMNDFVSCRESLKKRIDVFFIHIFETQKKRFFAKIISVLSKNFSQHDECFNIPILKLQSVTQNQYYLVDLSVIQVEKLYMISLNIVVKTEFSFFTNNSQAEFSNVRDVFWIKWTLQYLWWYWSYLLYVVRIIIGF